MGKRNRREITAGEAIVSAEGLGVCGVCRVCYVGECMKKRVYRDMSTPRFDRQKIEDVVIDER